MSEHDVIVFARGFVVGVGLIVCKLLFGRMGPRGGHYGTSQSAPPIPMIKGPCSAVPPAPTPQSTHVTLHEGSKPK